jgi:hypothetical protein
MHKALLLALAAFSSQAAQAQVCTGLCLQQTSCPGGGTTSISGTVYMPNGVVPLPNALVYVPNAPVAPFTPGVGCDSCSPSGSPLVSAISSSNGTFAVTNMPVGSNIPLVIQVGRWRRQIIVPSVTACTNTSVSAATSRLPRTRFEGDIPLTAVVTGASDQEECLLRQIGVADSEFTNPSGTGRIQFYLGSTPNGAGAQIDPTTPSENTLVGAQATMNQYDAVMMNCQGSTTTPSSAAKQVFSNFLSAGGRGLLFHYADGYLQNNPPLSSLVAWNPDEGGITSDPQTGYIDTSTPAGATFAQWLQLVAGGTYGQLPMSLLRHDYDGVVAPAVNLIGLNQSGQIIPQQFSANAPVGTPAGNQCGRITFLDNHPFTTTGSAGMTFPAECTNGPTTPQQLAAAYALFDAANCLAGPYDRIFANGFESGD